MNGKKKLSKHIDVSLTPDQCESIAKGENGSIGFRREPDGLVVTLYGKRGAIKESKTIKFDALVGVINQRVFYELGCVSPSYYMVGFSAERYADYANPKDLMNKPLPKYTDVRLNRDRTQSIVHSNSGEIGFLRCNDGLMIIMYGLHGAFKTSITIQFDALICVVEQRLIYELEYVSPSEHMMGFTTKQYASSK